MMLLLVARCLPRERVKREWSSFRQKVFLVTPARSCISANPKCGATIIFSYRKATMTAP